MAVVIVFCYLMAHSLRSLREIFIRTNLGQKTCICTIFY